MIGGSIAGFVFTMVGAQVLHNWLTDLKNTNEKEFEKEYIKRKW